MAPEDDGRVATVVDKVAETGAENVFFTFESREDHGVSSFSSFSNGFPNNVSVVASSFLEYMLAVSSVLPVRDRTSSLRLTLRPGPPLLWVELLEDTMLAVSVIVRCTSCCAGSCEVRDDTTSVVGSGGMLIFRALIRASSPTQERTCLTHPSQIKTLKMQFVVIYSLWEPGSRSTQSYS